MEPAQKRATDMTDLADIETARIIPQSVISYAPWNTWFRLSAIRMLNTHRAFSAEKFGERDLYSPCTVAED